MKKTYFILCYLFLLILFPGCDGDDTIEKWPQITSKYDPSKPASLEKILPAYGVIDETFMVEGNFPGELSEMKVYFGSKKAVLITTDGKTITGLVPKQSDGFNPVSVVAGTDSLAPEGLLFKYKQSRSIKTIAGKLGTRTWLDENGGNYNNIDINEVTFGEMHYVAAVEGVNGDNVIAIESGWGNRVFLISLDDNKVQKYDSPTNLSSPAVSSTRDMFYVAPFRDSGNRTIYVFKRDEGWAFSTTGITISQNDFSNAKSPSLTFAEDDNLLYLLDNEGRIAEISLADKSYTIYTAADKKPGTIDENVFGGYISGELPTNFGDWEDSFISYSKFHKCFFVSYTREHAIYKYVKNSDDSWTVELYAGRNGEGATPGHRLLDAQFHNPHGIIVNAEGEIFVCNKGHFINMIKGDAVEMISGKYNTWSPLSNGDPIEAILDQPRNMSMDFEGNYYFAGGMDGTVRKLSIE